MMESSSSSGSTKRFRATSAAQVPSRLVDRPTRAAQVPSCSVDGPTRAAQVPSCSVDGCTSDLSEAKHYHRRHKVCDLHAKAFKVIMKGQEQRFCQQCSRFHSLEEFDEFKRSCRKRLEGHNERRRKVHLESLPLNSGSFLTSYPEKEELLLLQRPKRGYEKPPSIVPKENEMLAYEEKPKEKNRTEKEMAAIAAFPPDLIFHCTDEQLVNHYLRLKNESHHSEIQIIPEVDFFNHDPKDLPEDSQWFFRHREAAYWDSSPGAGGFWLTTGFRFISSEGLISRKWTSVFYKGIAPYGERTQWMMHEYHAIKEDSSPREDDFVLCRLTTKERYRDGDEIIDDLNAYLRQSTAYSGDLARPVLSMKKLRQRLEQLAETSRKEAIEKQITLETQGELSEIAATDVKSKPGEKNEESGADYEASRKDKKLENEEIEIELETWNPGLERYSHTNILREIQGLREPPKDELWENAERICLMDNELSVLPENPKCAALLALYLQRNNTLRAIPSLFFDNMPALQILNLSGTGIRSLPESIVKLVNLKRLFLNNCHCFMMLSPKVGELKRLEVLDLEGTDILELPKETKKLTNLTCLKVSLYSYLDDGGSDMQSDSLVYCDIISELLHLEELSICVNPDDKWWIACVDAIVTEICSLKNLDSLELCFPRVELVKQFVSKSLVLPSLSHFRFTVGHHVKRILSRLPCDVEFELERSERCLKYINGVDVPADIKKLLQYSTSFFLERHATIRKLSKFGIGNMKQLSCCVIGECDQVEVIIDETDIDNEDYEFDSQEEDYEFDGHEEDDDTDDHEEDEEHAYSEDDRNEILLKTSSLNGVVLQSLEYLYIYYMKNLKRIWRGPIERECFSLLKSLTLRTCPKLTTIFTKALLDNLKYLEELTVEDCPSIATLVSYEISIDNDVSYFLPNFRRILLHNMHGLVTISCGSLITPKLEWMSFYNCPNLKSLCFEKESMKTLRKIKGQRSWWEALEWRNGLPSYLDGIFVPSNE